MQHYPKQQASQLPPARRRKKRRSGASRGWYTGRGLPRGLTRLRKSCGESGSEDRAVMKRYRAALRTARWVRAGWLAACAMRNILGSQKDQERDLTPAKATADPATAVAHARKVALQRPYEFRLWDEYWDTKTMCRQAKSDLAEAEAVSDQRIAAQKQEIEAAYEAKDRAQSLIRLSGSSTSS